MAVQQNLSAVMVGAILLSLLSSTYCEIFSGGASPIFDMNPSPVPTATYRGTTEIKIPNEQSNFTEYYISFASFTSGCNYAHCYYGWVSNYTNSGEDTVQGYPKGTQDVKPIFQFKTNSKTNFSIIRHPQLADNFVSIIEIGCQLFEPTIRSVSTVKGENSTRLLASSSGQEPQIQYTFEPEAQPTLLRSGSGKRDPSPSNLKVASVQKKLNLQNIQTKKNGMQEKITVDKDFDVVKRSRVVDLNIPSDPLTQNKQEKQLEFISNVKVDFVKAETKQTNLIDMRLSLYFLKNSRRQDQYTFTASNIEARRNDASKVKFYDQKFNAEDKNNLQSAQSSPSAAPAPLKALRGVSDAARGSVALCSSTPSPAAIEIYSYTKQLFSKQILGRQFNVRININAFLLDGKNVRIKGGFVYGMFGNEKSVQIFNYVKDIALVWRQSYDIGASWSFSIYIPLPSPVSFLGISFGFGVSFNNHIEVFVKGSPIITACAVQFQVGAIASTALVADASAALRVIAIEGGVFISGKLVELTTDPKLAITFNLATKAIALKVTWYFYINAFSFNWGFFYRYWRLFKGWSSKKIIKEWPINNGITKRYVIFE